ncbi:MAG: tRNA (adenosine(37)-N6)-threonylcarbamoyltransferase complex dimerization subunit type 1 TsaB [Erysipelotrichaceae bacterium]|jgi:tRNA threonylcarbamoyl adenosine modification protein YeaZ|nr:tRNA (adenosine(37)-N6)-threonylcarbamoyltransferase complex dimerization subunit type 1 TsaB [Erysipelotrichaceae bacterium]
MITILLDSSNRDLAVGIAKNDTLIEETVYEAWQRQSESMVPELDKLLRKHGIVRSDISDVVVGIGPGSYTGVRIALTIAKVLALALNVPLYGVSSLRMMKIFDKPTITLINARSNRSYIGVYEGNKIILKDQIMKNEDVINYVNEHPDYVLSGDLEYLNLDGVKADVIKEMLSLKKNLASLDNALGAKPIYLKD